VSPSPNRQILLASRPEGEPKPDNFRLVVSEAPEPAEGQVLLRTLWLSLDPYMRGRMSAAKSYAKPVEVGAVMTGGTVSEVAAARHRGFQVGDLVLGFAGWQEYALSDGKGLTKLDPAAAPVSTALSVLGMPGMTAYVGLLGIGEPKSGETLAVAAAAGPVGSAVGQIGKLKGCRVVGIAGGPDKVRYLRDELGFDAALDHRTLDFAGRLREAAFLQVVQLDRPPLVGRQFRQGVCQLDNAVGPRSGLARRRIERGEPRRHARVRIAERLVDRLLKGGVAAAAREPASRTGEVVREDDPQPREELGLRPPTKLVALLVCV